MAQTCAQADGALVVSRPLLLDGFCKAGGAGVGYHRAGFEVVGIDIEPQSRCPFRFVRGDFFEHVEKYGYLYDFIHASPHCQPYSRLKALTTKSYPMEIGRVREALRAAGVPYIIENVADALGHMQHPIMLCGTMFGGLYYRHRLFESNVLLWQPEHPRHIERVRTSHKSTGTFAGAYGNFTGVERARQAFGVPWMTRDEIAQHVPPVYTEYVGTQMMWHLEAVT